MSTLQQLVENVESASRSGVSTISQAELAVVDQVQEQYRALCPIPCTRCQYCQPCPSGVLLPDVFEVYNELVMYGDEGRARSFYSTLISILRINSGYVLRNIGQIVPELMPTAIDLS